MKIGFNAVNFDTNVPLIYGRRPAFVANEPLQQSVDNSDAEFQSKTKKTFSERIAGVWKFFSSADQLIKSYAKGILYGAIGGAFSAGLFWMFGSLPSTFKKGGPKLKDVLQHPIKYISTKGKVVSGLIATVLLAGNIISGYLQKNQRTAVIDHKLNVGHRDK